MCVKLSSGDLNPRPYPPHPTSTYTCGVTIAPRVCDGQVVLKLKRCVFVEILGIFFSIFYVAAKVVLDFLFID